MKLAVTLMFLLTVSLFTGGKYLNKTQALADGPEAHTATVNGQPDTIVSADIKSGRTMPGKMVLDDPDKKMTENAGDKGKVAFDHDQHTKLGDSCVACHHTNTEKLTAKVEEDVLKCGVCHKADEGECATEGTSEKRKFKGKTAWDSQTAFHGKGDVSGDRLAGCIDCHKARSDKFAKAKAVTTCKQCHAGG